MFLPRDSPPTLGSEFGVTPNTKPEVRLNGVGIWWITFGAVWTFLLVCGMIFLYRRRDVPSIKIRGLPLTFAGIVLLHLYWCTVQIGYSVGPLAPEEAEYWIMGIWYPFGIALFQAGNSQFLHIAKAQSRFARPPSQMTTRYDEKQRRPLHGGAGKSSSLWARLRAMDYSKRMFTFVTIGMALQLFLVVFIFLISRKFHPSFGIPGTEVTGATPMEISMKKGRGWEWWPSLFWQFLWAWVFAPVILWQARGIRDTHGWQLQTMVCCIAGLPAAPMWLVALYVPAMAPVNAYFIPPQWIALSIFVIEIFTIFLPCWQVLRYQALRQETLELLAQWEAKKNRNYHNQQRPEMTTITTTTTTLDGGNSVTATEDKPPLSPQSTMVATPTSSSHSPWMSKFIGFMAPTPPTTPPKSAVSTTTSCAGLVPEEAVLTMAALEHALQRNPEPLRMFSARCDFSGENIGFLTAVQEWRASLPPAFVRNGHNASPEIVREHYIKAVRIYTEFVSPRDAEFPINIAWNELSALKRVFERAARAMFGGPDDEHCNNHNHHNQQQPRGPPRRAGTNAVTPFDDVDWSAPHSPIPPSPPGSRGNHDDDGRQSSRGAQTEMIDKDIATPMTTRADAAFELEAQHQKRFYSSYQGEIPPTFVATVFDDAYDSIKYLVLTNTWPKYVKERRASEDSATTTATMCTDDTGGSSRRSLRRMFPFLKPLVGWS